jgi:hypothetical protein
VSHGLAKPTLERSKARFTQRLNFLLTYKLLIINNGIMIQKNTKKSARKRKNLTEDNFFHHRKIYFIYCYFLFTFNLRLLPLKSRK